MYGNTYTKLLGIAISGGRVFYALGIFESFSLNTYYLKSNNLSEILVWVRCSARCWAIRKVCTGL